LGNGATQLIGASVYAFCSVYQTKFTVFAKVPYYGDYQTACQYFPQCCDFTTNETMTDNMMPSVIEFVTHPNNPDGQPREKHYKNCNNTIYDLVYYWPHLSPSMNFDSSSGTISLWSMSKAVGAAGTRFGWAITKDRAIANAMSQYIGFTISMISLDSAHRALRLLNLLGSSEGNNLVAWVKTKFVSRWQILTNFFDKYENELPFTLAGTSDVWYMWIQCKNNTDCPQLLYGYGISTSAGNYFGSTSNYARLQLAVSDYTFDKLVAYLHKALPNQQQYK